MQNYQQSIEDRRGGPQPTDWSKVDGREPILCGGGRRRRSSFHTSNDLRLPAKTKEQQASNLAALNEAIDREDAAAAARATTNTTRVTATTHPSRPRDTTTHHYANERAAPPPPPRPISFDTSASSQTYVKTTAFICKKTIFEHEGNWKGKQCKGWIYFDKHRLVLI